MEKKRKEQGKCACKTSSKELGKSVWKKGSN